MNATPEAERCLEDQKVAERMGFSLDPPVYPIGTRVVKMGQDKLREIREKWEKYPLVEDAAEELARTIAAEQRLDVEIPLHQIEVEMNPFRLSVWGERLSLTRNGMLSLMTQAGIPRALLKLIEDRSPSIAGKSLELIHTTLGDDKEKIVNVRTRVQDDVEDRVTYAVVSRGYESVNHTTTWAQAADLFKGSGARAQAIYNPATTRADLRVLWVTPIEPEKAAAGEIFRAGVQLRNRDDGGGSFHVVRVLWRNRCLNFYIIGTAEIRTSVRHFGKAFKDRVDTAIAESHEGMGLMAERWNAARMSQVLNEDLEAKDLFLKLIKYDLVAKPTGVRRDIFADMLVEAWNEEPGNSKADIINAVSLAAHRYGWSSADDVAVLEQSAGALLVQSGLF